MITHLYDREITKVHCSGTKNYNNKLACSQPIITKYFSQSYIKLLMHVSNLHVTNYAFEGAMQSNRWVTVNGYVPLWKAIFVEVIIQFRVQFRICTSEFFKKWKLHVKPLGWKTHKCKFISNWMRKTVWLLTLK